MLHVMKGFFASFVCYIFLYFILFIINHHVNELFAVLIFQSIIGFFIILVQTIIIEICLKIEGYNRLFAIMIGFIYGIAISILFSGTMNMEISVHLLIGFMFSICVFVYVIVRNDSRA